MGGLLCPAFLIWEFCRCRWHVYSVRSGAAAFARFVRIVIRFRLLYKRSICLLRAGLSGNVLWPTDRCRLRLTFEE